MEPQTYIGYGLAAVSLLALLRVLWSTSGRQLALYRNAIQEGQRTIDKLQEDLMRVEEAREMLLQANRTLQAAIKQKDAEIQSQTQEIRALKRNLDNQRAANNVLNDTIGKQDTRIKELSKDVDSLKDQVLKLRAQMGLDL